VSRRGFRAGGFLFCVAGHTINKTTMDILRNKIILVADADQLRCEAVAKEFRKAGCRVHSAGGGIEAFEIASIHRVDAVLSSTQFSNGSPFLFLTDLRRLGNDIPVILFGAAESKITQTEAMHRGFAGFFSDSSPAALAEAAAKSLNFVEDRKQGKARRVAVVARADLTYGEPPVNVCAAVLNLSRSGMFLSLESGFPPTNSIVEFRMTLPDDGVGEISVSGMACVRWTRERQEGGRLPGVGLEFTELSGDSRKFVDLYVSRKSRD